MESQGWYRDPYGAHTDRWFSAGRPTNLVRDGGTESHDPPPSVSFDGALVRCDETEADDSRDLMRADDPSIGRGYVEAALDAAAQSGLGFN